MSADADVMAMTASLSEVEERRRMVGDGTKAYDEDRSDPRWRKTSAIDVMFAEKCKEIFCYVNSLISSF
jgi:L-rhamnose isomerase